MLKIAGFTGSLLTIWFVVSGSCVTLKAQSAGPVNHSILSACGPAHSFVMEDAEEDKAGNLTDLPPAQSTGPAASGITNGYARPTKRVRFRRYVSGTIGPFALLGAGFGAAIDQWNNAPKEWRQGAKGYGRRFASNFGQQAISNTVTYGLSEALRVDSSFYRSQRHGLSQRARDALLQNVTSRKANGRRVLSIPILAGFYAGGIIPATVWYPSRYNFKDGLRFGTISLAAGFGVNLAREFILHH